MSITSRRLRQIAAVAFAASLAFGAAACSKSQQQSAGPGETVTIKVQTFGQFGYDKAVADWNSTHSNIKIDHQRMGELRDFAPQLAQWLSAGSGAGDVVGLEEGLLLQYIKNHEPFLDLFTQGGQELKSNFIPWKWERGLADSGKKLLGLGTDVGGMALCYRTDLFAQAGLPTDREQVAAKIKSWEDYSTVGKEFAAKVKTAKWLDSATGVVQSYVMQKGDQFFFDKDDKFIGDTNPVVKEAWDYGVKLSSDGLTAKLARWSPDWDAAFKNSAFATIFCPAWMLDGVIKQRAGDAFAGKWDVAKMPGGGGNWGGSYLAVPKQTKHPKEAYEVAKYLTSKEGQLASYKEASTMPSNLAALQDPAFADSKNAYFSNAPVGKIFLDSVQGIEPMPLGSKHQQVWETVVEPAMQSAEQGKASSADAWKKAIDESKKLVAA